MTTPERLRIPCETEAILWDMDGVLLDTLGLDLVVCNRLIATHLGIEVDLERAYIRSLFAYHTRDFWQRILERVRDEFECPNALDQIDAICEQYTHARLTTRFELNEGIAELLEKGRERGLRQAVVSNNTTEEVRTILAGAGIADRFDQIVGNDIRDLQPKPAPDTYLFAAELLGVSPERCVVVEDSLLGAEAGHAAGCHTLGIATGANTFEELSGSGWTDATYVAFRPNRLEMEFGDPRNKTIATPNDFVSHMVEHIAWRLGVSIELDWTSDRWDALGWTLGKRIGESEPRARVGVALGMIDDGSAECVVDLDGDTGLTLSGTANVDLDWFLSLRCEQLSAGQPLVDLLEGLAGGLEASIRLDVCNHDDTHHTWEGAFRSVGIALSKCFTPTPDGLREEVIAEGRSNDNIDVVSKSTTSACVRRETAESRVEVTVDFSKATPNSFECEVAPSVDVSRLADLLDLLTDEAGFTCQVSFAATRLSSSHVAVEDTAMVLGRALREVLELRMIHWGVNGAGSSLNSLDDYEIDPLRVGLSVEGRKFWRLVPLNASVDDVRKQFVIGHNVHDTLFSEDLDDFLDGLAGSLGCSIMVHLKELPDPAEGWPLLFRALGRALREAFASNPYRRGVCPGVKATLA